MSEFVNKWNQAATKRAAAAREAAPMAAITLPGFEDFPFLGTRLPISEWMENGLVPQSLADKLIDFQQASEGDEFSIKGDELKHWYRLEKRIVQATIVEPRIVFEDRELNEGEFFAGNLPGGFMQAVMLWAIRLSSGVPVATVEGQTTLEAVETFRPDGARAGESIGVGAHSEDVQSAAIGLARPA